MSIEEYARSLFPYKRDNWELQWVSGGMTEHGDLKPVLRLVTFKADGNLDSVTEQECIVLESGEIEGSDPEALLQRRLEAIKDVRGDTHPGELFWQPPDVPVSPEAEAKLQAMIDEEVRSGLGTEADVALRFIEFFEEQAPEATDKELLRWNAKLQEALEAQRAREMSWTETSTNDRITRAFADLTRRGVIALEGAGYTQSEGWEDIAEARETVEGAWAGTLYHRQSAERGLANQGLELAFGAFEPDDDTTRKAAKIICEVLEHHKVRTSWCGSIDKKITILPFEWRRRRVHPSERGEGIAVMIRLEYQDAKSHKFWEVTLDGATLTTVTNRSPPRGRMVFFQNWKGIAALGA